MSSEKGRNAVNDSGSVDAEVTKFDRVRTLGREKKKGARGRGAHFWVLKSFMMLGELRHDKTGVRKNAG